MPTGVALRQRGQKRLVASNSPNASGSGIIRILLLDATVKTVKTVNSTTMPRRLTVKTGQPRYLTTRQSAVRLGVTINAIKTWIRDERLPALKTPGGHHRIAESDLLQFHAIRWCPPGVLRAGSRSS